MLIGSADPNLWVGVSDLTFLFGATVWLCSPNELFVGPGLLRGVRVATVGLIGYADPIFGSGRPELKSFLIGCTVCP